METWQKILVGVLIIAVLGLGFLSFTLNRTINEQETTIAQLQIDLANAMNQPVEQTQSIFRVVEQTRIGTLFNPTNVEVVQIPNSLMSEAFVTDPEMLRNSIWRISLEAEGLITHDMLAFEPVGPTDRFRVIPVSAFSPSLRVGDFVDFRMITPDGLDFVVFPQKRIINIFDAGLEVILNETEWMVFLGAMADLAIYSGSVFYADRYVDPALQNRMFATYIPPRHIIDFMNINRNMIFPYADYMDIEGMRALFEATQPWYRYQHTMFNNTIQAIRHREAAIVGAVGRQMGAMNQARTQYVQMMREYYARQGLEWEGAGPSQVAQTGAMSGGGAVNQPGSNVGQVNPDGTWFDSAGTLRHPDGTPVIGTQQMINYGGPDQEEADIVYNTWFGN